MAWTQTDLDRIEAAIASGVLTVKLQDKEVTYQSMEALLKARDIIRRALGQASTTGRVFPTFAKGTNS